jgi:hypothetical protein
MKRKTAELRVIISRHYYKLERRRFRRARSFSQIRNFIRGGRFIAHKAGALRRRNARLRSLIWRGKPNVSLRLIHVRLQQYFNFPFAEFRLHILPLSAAQAFFARGFRSASLAALRAIAQGAGGGAILLNKKASFFEKIIAFRRESNVILPLTALQHSLVTRSLQMNNGAGARTAAALLKFSQEELYSHSAGRLSLGLNLVTFYETDFFKKSCLKTRKDDRELITNPSPSSYVLDIIKAFFLFLINSRVLLFLNFELYVRLTF